MYLSFTQWQCDNDAKTSIDKEQRYTQLAALNSPANQYTLNPFTANPVKALYFAILV